MQRHILSAPVVVTKFPIIHGITLAPGALICLDTLPLHTEEVTCIAPDNLCMTLDVVCKVIKKFHAV